MRGRGKHNASGRQDLRQLLDMAEWVATRRVTFSAPDLVREFGCSKACVYRRLEEMVDAGWIELWEPQVAGPGGQPAVYHSLVRLTRLPVDGSALLHDRRCELAAGMGGEHP